jgi:hypothetical protein
MARRTRRSGLMMLPTNTIYKELRRRERQVAKVQLKRDKLAAKMDVLDSMIREMGGTVGGRRGRVGAIPGRKRPKNDTNLVEALAKVLKGKTMRVRDMVGAVQQAGYRTSAENFRTIVNQALIKNRSVFKKIGRGQYTAA